MGKPVVHFEIGCRDKAKTVEFYSTLFEWNIQEMGPAAMIATGADTGIQGHITSLGHEPHNYTHFYVQVENLEEYLRKAESLGGRRSCRRCRFQLEDSRGWPIRRGIP